MAEGVNRRDALVPHVESVVRGGNLIVREESIRDAVRQVLLPSLLENTYFFTLYAGACNKGEGLRSEAHRPVARAVARWCRWTCWRTQRPR